MFIQIKKYYVYILLQWLFFGKLLTTIKQLLIFEAISTNETYLFIKNSTLGTKPNFNLCIFYFHVLFLTDFLGCILV